MEVGLPRHQPNNPYKYSKTELAVRKSAIKALHRDFPDVPLLWAELVYDTMNHLKDEEVQEMIDKGLFDKESKYKAIGGVSNDVEVLDPQ
jgi:hypothetical protein